MGFDSQLWRLDSGGEPVRWCSSLTTPCRHLLILAKGWLGAGWGVGRRWQVLSPPVISSERLLALRANPRAVSTPWRWDKLAGLTSSSLGRKYPPCRRPAAGWLFQPEDNGILCRGKSPNTSLKQSGIPAPIQLGLSSMQWEPDWSSQGWQEGWKHFIINAKVLKKVSSWHGKLPGCGQPHTQLHLGIPLGSKSLHLKLEGLNPIPQKDYDNLGGVSIMSRRFFLVISFLDILKPFALAILLRSTKNTESSNDVSLASLSPSQWGSGGSTL